MFKKLIISITFIISIFINFSLVQATNNDSINNFNEFSTWIKEHKDTGGTLTLNNDIHINQNFNFTDLKNPNNRGKITIDCNNYTIYIEANVDFTYLAYNLRFVGDNTIFHVKQGASLYLDQGVFETNNYAIVQDEGSILCVDDSCDPSQISYAKKPVIDPYAFDPTYYYTYKKHASPNIQDFTKEVNYIVYYQGKSYRVKLPISWNINELDEAYDLNCYYPMTGRPTGPLSIIDESIFAGITAEQAVVLRPITTNVIWTEDGFSISNIRSTAYNNSHVIIMQIDSQDFSLDATYDLMMKKENQTSWQSIQSFSGDPTNIQFFLETDSPCQFYIQITTDQETKKTNVINFINETYQSVPIIDGNRGGGTSLIPSDDNEDETLIPSDKITSPNSDTIITPQSPPTNSIDSYQTKPSQPSSPNSSQQEIPNQKDTTSQDTALTKQTVNNNIKDANTTSNYQVLIGVLAFISIGFITTIVYKKNKLNNTL